MALAYQMVQGGVVVPWKRAGALVWRSGRILHRIPFSLSLSLELNEMEREEEERVCIIGGCWVC